jgi:hypothetical protein
MKQSDSHIMGPVMLVVLVLLVIAALVCLFSPRLRPRFLKAIPLLLGGVLALFLIGRAIAEFWVVDYSNPASYQNAWGGPSLVGVFIVHSGPGLAILIGGAIYLFKRLKKRSHTSAKVMPKPPGK